MYEEEKGARALTTHTHTPKLLDKHTRLLLKQKTTSPPQKEPTGYLQAQEKGRSFPEPLQDSSNAVPHLRAAMLDSRYVKSWGLSFSTSVFKRNGDFTLVFFNLILPLFQNEGRLYPCSVKST